MIKDCPFCHIPPADRLMENDWFLVILDRFPISLGHSLIIPKLHIGSIFELTQDAFNALYDLINQVKRQLDEQYKSDGYNIGINNGEAAGQTISHLHIHLIPRYKGDQKDPRGGVRWIFPEKADYWSKTK